MNEWANAWTRYHTASQGNYIVAAMEDSGTLQALTFLSQANRVDFGRVLVLRTVSNYDREAPGVTAAESLQEMGSGNYSADYAGFGGGPDRRRQGGTRPRGALGGTRVRHSSRTIVKVSF